MKIWMEQSLRDFEFWSGAKSNASQLNDEQFDRLESYLEDLYPDGVDEYVLNDLFWHDFDWIRDILGMPEEDE